jgi:CheY-like chemotaxis protein
MTVFQVYLASAGARVRVVPDLAAAREHMNVSPSNTVLLLDLAQENGLTTDDAMQQQWANDQRVVRLVRHGRSGSETKVIEVRARPLIYHDLLNGVALACGRKVITDLVLHKEKEIPQRQAPGVEQARAQGRLVLLAEDNEINRDVIQEQLRLLGYAAEQAADGAIALEMWRSGRYALLLTDCHMPNMDGFELTANIRAAEQPGTHLPIIAITANAMQGEAERCRERGMDDYLSKPLRMVDLDEKLQHWLPFNGEKALAPLPEQAPVAAASPANGQIAWDSQALTRVVGNNQNMQKRLLEMFLEKAQSQVADITSAHAQSDMAGTASVAHTLKSAARTVGALLLSDACQAIETAARANDHTAVTALVPTLAAHLRAAQARIQEHLAP